MSKPVKEINVTPPVADEDMRARVMSQAQGALSLYVAFIGVANHLFETLAKLGEASVTELAAASAMDAAYLQRWCEAAYANGYLDEGQGRFTLTALGQAFRPDLPGNLMPFAVQSVLSAHMAERATTFMRSGERPGEKVLAERANILPWFGPMLETMFGSLFEQQILAKVPVYGEVNARGGMAVDLGCGNGWYLRKLAAAFPHLRGMGLDGFDENIRQATQLAQSAGVGDRLRFQVGDIYHYSVPEPADLIAMNRALHHVWDEKDKVFAILRDSLKPGGAAVIWEPNWPREISALRDPSRRGMAFQNLGEHIQGNHFLRPEDISAEFEKVGMAPSVYLFANGNEAVVVGRKAG
jgi:SAM-dependent methyltransferase